MGDGVAGNTSGFGPEDGQPAWAGSSPAPPAFTQTGVASHIPAHGIYDHDVTMTWRKSTRCSGGGCIEIGWRRSTRCGGGECVEVADLPTGWRTAHNCSDSACVEVSDPAGNTVGIRDSKRDDSPVLEFTRDAFADFIAGIKAGDFD